MPTTRRHAPLSHISIPATVHDYAQRYSRVLIKRTIGGIGDILNHRMMFQDLKAAVPHADITFAVPRQWEPLIRDHPFIDHAEALDRIDESEYTFVYDTSNVAGRYEYGHLPNRTEGVDVDKHRSDIWAAGMGLELAHHEGFLRFTEKEKQGAARVVADSEPGKRIAIATKTASLHKDWSMDRWQETITALATEGYSVYSFHAEKTAFKGCINVEPGSLRHWMAAVAECDYVFTVATYTFCLANLLHKPTVAIFGCENLDVYGRWFPEMVAVQRHRDRHPEWQSCPCWDSISCEYNPDGKPPPACLRDISVKEVMKAWGDLLARDPAEYYDARYFTAGGCKGWYDGTAFAKDNQFHKDRAEDIIAILAPAKGAKILDAGTARANIPYWLTALGYCGFGCDVSRWAIKNTHIAEDRVACADIADIRPWPDGHFDHIVSRDSLEHVPQAKVLSALRNMARMLRAGGTMMHWIATDRNQKEAKKQSNPHNYDESHVCIKPPDWWLEQFARADLICDYELTVKAMHRPDAVRYDWDCLVLRKP